MSGWNHPWVLPARRSAGRHTPARLGLKRLTDRGLDQFRAVRGIDRRLDVLAATQRPSDVLVVGVQAKGVRLASAVAELQRSRHRVRVVLGAMPDRARPELGDVVFRTDLRGGKFANVNVLLDAAPKFSPRWTIVIDDDVRLPHRFLDRFLLVCEIFDLVLAQPALTLRSYHSHPITRRDPLAVARETRFVEIGPLTAFRGDTRTVLLPFPDDAGMGWALDRHWPVIATQRGWKIGIVDATPIGHEDAPAATAYSRDRASLEADAFLATHPSISVPETLANVAVHRNLPQSKGVSLG